jgi:hypothetical protein
VLFWGWDPRVDKPGFVLPYGAGQPSGTCSLAKLKGAMRGRGTGGMGRQHLVWGGGPEGSGAMLLVEVPGDRCWVCLRRSGPAVLEG